MITDIHNPNRNTVITSLDRAEATIKGMKRLNCLNVHCVPTHAFYGSIDMPVLYGHGEGLQAMLSCLF